MKTIEEKLKEIPCLEKCTESGGCLKKVLSLIEQDRKERDEAVRRLISKYEESGVMTATGRYKKTTHIRVTEDLTRLLSTPNK